MPASAAYRFRTMSMYCRDHRNNVASGFACASSSNGDSSNKGSLSNRRACNVARLFFSRLTESLPSQISRPRIASISDTRSPCSNPTSMAMWCSLLWSRATLNSRTPPKVRSNRSPMKPTLRSGRRRRLTFQQPVSLADSLQYSSFLGKSVPGLWLTIRNPATESDQDRGLLSGQFAKLKVIGIGNSCSRRHFVPTFTFSDLRLRRRSA